MIKENNYPYECPQCGEFVLLEPDEDSIPFAPELKGYCDNCHLDISIYEDEWEEWNENQFKKEVNV